jgi:hypothetical protein
MPSSSANNRFNQMQNNNHMMHDTHRSLPHPGMGSGGPYQRNPQSLFENADGDMQSQINSSSQPHFNQQNQTNKQVNMVDKILSEFQKYKDNEL